MTAVLDRPASEVLAARTRRSFIAGGLGVGAALLGCGGDGDEGARSPAQEPVRMTHKYGTTTVPAAPRRVVAAGFNDADYVLALGLKPVGVANFIGPFREQQRSWAKEQLAGSDPPLVSNGDGELRFERIAALDPDVIVFYSYLQEGDYKRLAAIAPTVVEPNDGALWPQHTLDVGRALGRDRQARRLVQDVRERFAGERDAHPEFAGKTASILFGFTGGPNVFVLEPTDPRSGLFTSLGMKMPSRTGEISREQVQLLDSDLLVVVGTDRKVVEQDPLLRRLDAVRDGRVAYLGGFEQQFAGALGFDSPLSLPAALDVAVPVLAAAALGRS